MGEERSHLHSEERSQDLLRQWLSPDQAEQYDKFQRFEVVGSDTGTRYRIRLGTTMNVEEIAANGRIARRWCFAPEGAPAAGDVMLAQKIALETNEARLAFARWKAFSDACHMRQGRELLTRPGQV
jgi:hypothetical protein